MNANKQFLDILFGISNLIAGLRDGKPALSLIPEAEGINTMLEQLMLTEAGHELRTELFPADQLGCVDADVTARGLLPVDRECGVLSTFRRLVLDLSSTWNDCAPSDASFVLYMPGLGNWAQCRGWNYVFQPEHRCNRCSSLAGVETRGHSAKNCPASKGLSTTVADHTFRVSADSVRQSIEDIVVHLQVMRS